MRLTKVLVFIMQAFVYTLFLGVPVFLIYVFGFVFYSGDTLKAQPAVKLPAKACEQHIIAPQTFQAGAPFYHRSDSGFSYFIKTPVNYSASQAWPLLVIFTPTVQASLMERFTGLTADVTRAGFVIAYVDAVPMNLNTIAALDELSESISKWVCIDDDNLFLAGHSDGASIAQALHFLPEVKGKYRGFISSAAGVTGNDLLAYSCPKPVNVFVLQNVGDRHFRNFGQSNVQWWADCFACEQAEQEAGGCRNYRKCQNDVTVRLCEQEGGHLKWPPRQKEMVDFLENSLR